jgi:hypothetical protein
MARSRPEAALLLVAATLAAGCSGDGGKFPGRDAFRPGDDRAEQRAAAQDRPRPARRPSGRETAFLRRVNRACRRERRRVASLRADLRAAGLGGGASRARARRALSRLLRATRRVSRQLAALDPPPGRRSRRVLAYLDARGELESALEVYRDAVLIGEVDAYSALERERSRMTSRGRRLAARAGLRSCAAA